jgi:hypothetical protein
VLPKFAIPMREVGDRYQNIYFAAMDGNWGLAFYMSKYINGARAIRFAQPGPTDCGRRRPEWRVGARGDRARCRG